MNPDPNINHEIGSSSKLPPKPQLCGKERPNFFRDFNLPDAEYNCGLIGDLGIDIRLRSLGNSLPSERGLVAACLIEIARAINETIPADAGNQPQH